MESVWFWILIKNIQRAEEIDYLRITKIDE